MDLDFFLDIFSYRAHRAWQRAWLFILAFILFAAAYLTHFSFPWGATFLYLSIGLLLWATRLRVYGLVAIGVLLALLWGAQLSPDLFGTPAKSDKQVAAKQADGQPAKQAPTKAGKSSASKPEAKNGSSGSSCAAGAKCQMRQQHQPVGEPSTIGGLFAAIKPLLGAMIIFALVIGVCLAFMGSLLRDSKGFITGKGRG